MGVEIVWQPPRVLPCPHPGSAGAPWDALLWCPACGHYLKHWIGDWGAQGWYALRPLMVRWHRWRGRLPHTPPQA